MCIIPNIRKKRGDEELIHIQNVKLQKTIGNKVMKVIGVLVGSIFILVIGILIFYRIKSPGKMIQYRDKEGNVLKNSIASKEYVEINGTKLGMIIKSKDLSNPVLLFLHGGVGMPEYPMTWDYPTYLENHFTI